MENSTFAPLYNYKSVYLIWYDQLTVISDAILALETMLSTVNVASECVTHRHIASIIILVLLYFLSIANGKIFKIAAKLVAILNSILDF